MTTYKISIKHLPNNLDEWLKEKTKQIVPIRNYNLQDDQLQPRYIFKLSHLSYMLRLRR